MSTRLVRTVILLLLIGLVYSLNYKKVFHKSDKESKELFIYAWVDYFAPSVIADFEKETGIKVIYDVYDDCDFLDAKLITGNSGYDLVCPSLWPHVSEQINMGLFEKIDAKLIPNMQNIDPRAMEKIAQVPEGKNYVIPYVWGVMGIGIHTKRLAEALGLHDLLQDDKPITLKDLGLDLNSWGTLLDEKNARQLARCGLSLCSTLADVMPLTLYYLGLNPRSNTKEHWETGLLLLEKLRPYVRKFNMYQAIYDLSRGELCAVLGYASEIERARIKMGKKGKHITVIIPNGVSNLWIDGIMIPKKAPNRINAHKFINFLLRPENFNRAMAHLYAFGTLKKNLIDTSNPLRNNPKIYLPGEIIDKAFVGSLLPFRERKAIKYRWDKLKGKF